MRIAGSYQYPTMESVERRFGTFRTPRVRMLSIFARANPQPIREPGDVVEILKLAA